MRNSKKQQSETIEQLMSSAEVARKGNHELLEMVRQDSDLADRVRQLLCEDLRRVYAIPREILGPSASRDRYRQYGHYSVSLVTYLIGDWATFKRMAGIEENLAVKSVLRNIGRTTRAQIVADYADRNVKPWHGAYSRLDESKESLLIQVGSDFHSKFMDPFAKRVWLDVARRYKPDGIRFNGDLPDFPKLSKHRQLPGHFALNLQQEIDICVDFMGETRKRSPNSDIKWILGNHDMRLVYALAEAAPVYCDLRSINFGELFQLDKLKIGLVARPTFLNPTKQMRDSDIAQNWETIADTFTIVHGWLLGADAPAKHMQRFMRYGTNGHLHQPAMASHGSDATGCHQWWQTPCMAYPPAVAAEYMPGPIDASGWASGFAMFTIFPEQRRVCGEMIIVTDVATYRGQVWHITDEEREARERLLEI